MQAKHSQTTFAKSGSFEQEWFHVDAEGQIVGRLASRIATILMGKHKAIYTPHVDTGDFIVVTNCEKVHFTGAKWEKKVYRHHTGHIGGLVETKASKVRAMHPERVLHLAVRRMLPKTKLGRQMISKLKIYAGAEHPHAAQAPKSLTIETRRAARG